VQAPPLRPARPGEHATAPHTFALFRVLLTLAVAITLGAMLAPDVDARKNTGRKPTSIAAHVKIEKQRCEKNGGKIQVTYKVGSADSFCTGAHMTVANARILGRARSARRRARRRRNRR
jgi:hypothetical protein